MGAAWGTLDPSATSRLWASFRRSRNLIFRSFLIFTSLELGFFHSFRLVGKYFKGGLTLLGFGSVFICINGAQVLARTGEVISADVTVSLFARKTAPLGAGLLALSALSIYKLFMGTYLLPHGSDHVRICTTEILHPLILYSERVVCCNCGNQLIVCGNYFLDTN
jgi:hypothetical protein